VPGREFVASSQTFALKGDAAKKFRQAYGAATESRLNQIIVHLVTSIRWLIVIPFGSAGRAL
jgi:hypothetical protein